MDPTRAAIGHEDGRQEEKTNKPTWLQMSKEKIGCTLMHFTYIPPHHETHTEMGRPPSPAFCAQHRYDMGSPLSLSLSQCVVCFCSYANGDLTGGKKRALGEMIV